MKKTGLNVKRFLPALIAPIAAAISAAFCTLLFTKYSDPPVVIDNVYEFVFFKKGAPVVCFIVFLALCTLLFAAWAVYMRKSVPTYDSDLQKACLTFPRSAAGLFLLFTVGMQFFMKSAYTPYDLTNAKAVLESAKNLSSLSADAKQQVFLLVFKVLSLVFAVLAACYFLLPLFFEKKDLKKIKAIACFFVIAWLCLQLLLVHFFTYDHLNSPARILRMLSVCTLIFFFLSEMHYLLPGQPLEGLHTSLGMIAGLFAVTDGVSKLILSFKHSAGFSINLSTFYTLAFFALGLYALFSSVAAVYEARREIPAPVTGAEDGAEAGNEPAEDAEGEIETAPADGEDAAEDKERAPAENEGAKNAPDAADAENEPEKIASDGTETAPGCGAEAGNGADGAADRTEE